MMDPVIPHYSPEGKTSMMYYYVALPPCQTGDEKKMKKKSNKIADEKKTKEKKTKEQKTKKYVEENIVKVEKKTGEEKYNTAALTLTYKLKQERDVAVRLDMVKKLNEVAENDDKVVEITCWADQINLEDDAAVRFEMVKVEKKIGEEKYNTAALTLTYKLKQERDVAARLDMVKKLNEVAENDDQVFEITCWEDRINLEDDAAVRFEMVKTLAKLWGYCYIIDDVSKEEAEGKIKLEIEKKAEDKKTAEVKKTADEKKTAEEKKNADEEKAKAAKIEEELVAKISAENRELSLQRKYLRSKKERKGEDHEITKASHNDLWEIKELSKRKRKK